MADIYILKKERKKNNSSFLLWNSGDNNNTYLQTQPYLRRNICLHLKINKYMPHSKHVCIYKVTIFCNANDIIILKRREESIIILPPKMKG